MLFSRNTPRSSLVAARDAVRVLRKATPYVALGIALLGVGPVACISDATISSTGVAGISGGVGEAGQAPATPASGGTANGTASGGGGAGGISTNTLVGGTASGGTAGIGGVVAEAAGEGGEAGGVICDGCRLSPLVLPAPCETNSAPYSAPLHASGGVAPYTGWRLSATSGAWAVNAEPTQDGADATLTGPQDATTSVSVGYTDGLGRGFEKTYTVVPRTYCWFAFTALDPEGPQLHLIDPILELAAPALRNNQGVYDFHFSPDGKFLAYRFGEDSSHPTGKQLALVNLSTSTEQVLALGESVVTAYAWSGDASVLAVAFEAGGVASIGGFRLDATGAPTALTPTQALVDSDLYWIGTGLVAFYAAASPIDNDGNYGPDPSVRSAFYSKLRATTFQAPVAPSEALFYPGVQLQPASDGFFMLTGTDPFTYFDSVAPGVPAASHSSASLVAPSGHYSAALQGTQLRVYAAADGDSDPVATSAPGEGCPKILAWDEHEERIACVADTSTSAPVNGEVRFFELGSSSTLTMSVLGGACQKSVSTSCDAQKYDYTEASAAGQARAFSPSGKWFAFTTGSLGGDSNSYLYWADMGVRPWTLKRKALIEAGDAKVNLPTELGFSADDHFLLLQRGGRLFAFDLTAPQNSGPGSIAAPIGDLDLPTGTPSTALCSEDFPSDPAHWCGSADRAAPFTWSSSSTFAAFQDVGELQVVDFTPFPTTVLHTYLAPDCNQKCAGQFAFQPN